MEYRQYLLWIYLRRKEKKLLKKLGANIDIVEAGTLLMDCALGRALKENRLKDHVKNVF